MVNKIPEARPPLTLPTEGAGAQRPGRSSGLIQLLVQQLGKTPQTATTAEVQASTPITAEQRQQLINRVVDTLLQWQRQPDSAHKTEQLARLSDERALLNAPLLKLVRLSVRQESVTTYTDQPLKPGQRVPVYLAENRLWQLAAKPAPQNPTEATQRLSEPARQAIAETLRRALPLKDQPDLTQQLPKIQSLTYMQQRQLLSPTLQQALRQAAQQIRHPLQLTQPNTLRQSVENSGVQLEQRMLRALSAAKTAEPGPASSSGGDSRRAEAITRVMTNDWKGALLKVLSATRSELSRLGQPPELPRGSELNLPQLLQQLATRPAPELADRSVRSQLLQMVHQLTLHSLARVQMHQSQGVAQQLAVADTGQPSHTWTMDIPLRFGQEVHTMMLRIEPEPDKDGAAERSGKIRQWQVQLSFELPEAGQFYAQITVRQQQVATRLWAEKPETADAIRGQLGDLQSRLEREGIEVTKLECHTGAPPQPVTDIHYSLVDITT